MSYVLDGNFFACYKVQHQGASVTEEVKGFSLNHGQCMWSDCMEH